MDTPHYDDFDELDDALDTDAGELEEANLPDSDDGLVVDPAPGSEVDIDVAPPTFEPGELLRGDLVDDTDNSGYDVELADVDSSDADDTDVRGHDTLAVTEPEPVDDLTPTEFTLGSDPDQADGADDLPVEYTPPTIDVGDVPEPVDGYPWADPTLLDMHLDGDAAHVERPPSSPEGQMLDDLRHDASPADGHARDWDELGGDEDPAVRHLAQFWRPVG